MFTLGLNNRMKMLRFILVLGIASATHLASAQQAPTAVERTDVTDSVTVIDRLIEQNRKLEEQNHELMDQVTALRHAMVMQNGTESQRQSPSDIPVTIFDAKQQDATTVEAESRNNPQSSNPKQVTNNQSAGPKPAGEGYQEPLLWGEWNPGKGFKVASSERGDLNVSGYLVARYLNQLPADQKALDHLGRPIAVQSRQDYQLHRIMLYTSGWFLDPKFKYYTFVWSVNDTSQVAVGGTLTYEFNKRFALGIGINALPISRSVQGNHPYWPSYDRVMADEFFRPFFTQGVFGGGELVHRLYYKWMSGNNLSTLGVKATQLDRHLNFGGSLTWMPSTGEFGPRGALGDFESHDKLATRFGVGWGFSRENRQSNENDPANNTTIRLADSLNVFDPGTFAPGVTVQRTTYHLLAADAGIKKRGIWIGAEGYYRLLDNFEATGGPMPVGSVRDTGFYVQGTAMVVPKTVELYAGTSYVFSDYGKPKEVLGGGNWYPSKNRNYRLNVHFIHVDHSPVNSTFGFYSGQITGNIVAVGVTALY